MSKIYLLVGEEQQGPYSLEEIRKMISSGKVSNDTPCWEEGMAEWQALEKRLDQRPDPVTIAPPRRSRNNSDSIVDFKDALRKKGELSVRRKPFTIGKAVIALILFFVALTILIDLFSRTLPDTQKDFEEQTNTISSGK